MSGFIQAVAGVLVAAVLCSVLTRYGKDISVLLGLAVCGMVLGVAAAYLSPVVEFVRQLGQLSQLSSEWLTVVLKTVGIGIISQIAGLICTDSGNSALAKAVEILAAAAVLWLSIPLMTALLELVQRLAGGL